MLSILGLVFLKIPGISRPHTQRKRRSSGELERYGDYFVNLIVQLLSTYKESLGSSVTQIRGLVQSLSSSQGATMAPDIDGGSSKVINPWKHLEEEYLDMEAKFLTTLSVVETMKKQFYIQTEGIFRRDDQKVKELFDAIKKIKDEFESIDRPILEIKASPQRPETTSSDALLITPSTSPLATGTPEFKKDEVSNSSLIRGKKTLDAKEEMTKPLTPGTTGFKQEEVSKSATIKGDKALDQKEQLVIPLTTGTPESKQDTVSKSSLIKGEQKLEPTEEKAKPFTTGTLEVKQDGVSSSSSSKGKTKPEVAKVEPEVGKLGKEDSAAEIIDSVFDELEKELKACS